jgi:hypothetical protein
VEIPEAERERVAGLLHGFEHDRMRSRCPGSDECELWYDADVRAQHLLAALPYLAPAGEPLDFDSVELRDAVGAEVFRGLHGNGTVHFDTDVENNAMRDWTNYFVKSTLRALKAIAPSAPAGDGGLREALMELAKERDSVSGHTPSDYTIKPYELFDLLKAHPAAPAVPQPALIADRTGENALAEWLEEVFSADEDTITWEAAAKALFDLGAVREAAVPQPVDREALERLAEKWATMDTPGLSSPSNQDWAQGVDQGYSNAAAELLALLNGSEVRS